MIDGEVVVTWRLHRWPFGSTQGRLGHPCPSHRPQGAEEQVSTRLRGRDGHRRPSELGFANSAIASCHIVFHLASDVGRMRFIAYHVATGSADKPCSLRQSNLDPSNDNDARSRGCASDRSTGCRSGF